MKIVINDCHGGFGLSEKAINWLTERGFKHLEDLSMSEEHRNDPLLVECVETLGKDVNTFASKLTVVEIPDDVDFVIEDYDGWESIAERHRTWRA